MKVTRSAHPQTNGFEFDATNVFKMHVVKRIFEYYICNFILRKKAKLQQCVAASISLCMSLQSEGVNAHKPVIDRMYENKHQLLFMNVDSDYEWDPCSVYSCKHIFFLPFRLHVPYVYVYFCLLFIFSIFFIATGILIGFLQLT